MYPLRVTITFIFLIMMFSLNRAYSIDPGSFTIRINNFSEKVYSDKTSRFRLASSDSRFGLVNSAFQKIKDTGMNGSKHSLAVVTGVTSPRVKPADNKDLKDNMYINMRSPAVKEMAGQFSRSKDKPADIEKYVFNYISNKTIGIPLLTSDGIIKSRAGDCTEHAILSLSLLRSNGVPARAVVGVYLAEEFMGEKNVFVYHMWVEAYYMGKWLLVDATRPGKKAYNRYIAFTYHSLKSQMPLSYLRAISAIQDMDITLLD